MGGPTYLDWDLTPKNRPSREILDQLLESLRDNWQSIAGEHIARVTLLVDFSGAKARCLKVKAYADAQPPWGAWDRLPADETQRRTFTKLRSSINARLAPHGVDHIQFITTLAPPALWSNESRHREREN